MSWPRKTDFLIIGGGIIGISIALEISNRFPDSKIVLIEKESKTGQHASGRNSGVLHAGFYYSANSLKAKLTRDGNRELTEYCLERHIPINRCGKLVVARNETELCGLQELLQRGKTNQVDVALITSAEAREIEPNVKTFEQALYSPTTASINPVDIMQSLTGDAEEYGIQLLMDISYLGNNDNCIRTNQGDIEAGYIINAAGLYADRIAHQFGFADKYTILPFKGLYLNADANEQSLQCNIYPVPDLHNPFLGVHFTVTVDGKIKIGPTAMPVFWRENYKGFENFRLDECLDILGTEFHLLLGNDFNFRTMAIEELRKISKRYLVKLAMDMVSNINPDSFNTWGKTGIRAQLVNRKNRELVMDFCYEGDDRSFHVLNAVSPAFTCAMPFSRLVVDKIEQSIH